MSSRVSLLVINLLTVREREREKRHYSLTDELIKLK